MWVDVGVVKQVLVDTLIQQLADLECTPQDRPN
jgi:hypothetical protein